MIYGRVRILTTTRDFVLNSGNDYFERKACEQRANAAVVAMAMTFV
tara:strand:- start:652 stop:789 length:138 start_codon:yes stop_codon:yes gene_type:complete